MKKSLEQIGLVNEEELMELAGGTEVEQRSSLACSAVIVPVTIWTVQDSMNSCPTTACSSRC